MNRKAWSSFWPLAVAIATVFIAIEATTVRGQIGADDETDLVFEQRATLSSGAIQQVGATMPDEQPTATRPGVTTVVPAGANSPSGLNRNLMHRYQPKTSAGGKSVVASGKKVMPPAAANGIPKAAKPVTAAPATASAATPATASTQSTKMGSDSSPALATPKDANRVVQVSHYYPTDVVDRDGGDVSQLRKPRRMPAPPLVTTNPADQATAPGIRGALFGLQGTTATERLYQLQSQYAELQRENDELRRETASAMARLKESQDQMLGGAREIQIARKELSAARSDLDRLRNELQNLREKVRMAEKEHSAVLQTIGPLLQQLLESDEVSALPPKPVERD